MKVALTIGGSDPSGGAGIQADLKTFACLGVHGLSIITCITAQNTRGISSIHELPPKAIHEQISSIKDDIHVDFSKTGMLFSREIMDLVWKEIDFPLVVDPVMRSQSGDSLIKDDALPALKKVISKAQVVTPNIHEASLLSGIKIRSFEDAKRAAKEIFQLGANVIITGGHLSGTHILYDGNFRFFKTGRIRKRLHGAGCTFSSALTAELAKGVSLEKAVDSANRFVQSSVITAEKIGEGLLPVNQIGEILEKAERCEVERDVRDAVRILEESKVFVSLIPEVGTNVGRATERATSKQDVCAVSGRIVKVGGKAKAAGPINFGASDHIARIILSAMKIDPELRAAMNIRYSPSLLKKCRKLRLKISSFERKKLRERRTLDAGIKNAFQSLGESPDIIYDHGDVGKEPQIRILGRTAKEVVEKALRIGNGSC
jgi:hydroxymethylpyrimidine/phosphomethylpyrimidine kinase